MILQKENDSTWVPLTFLAYRRPQWPVGSHQCLSLHEAPRQDPQEVRPLGRLCSATWSSLWIQLSPKTSHWEVPHTWDIIWWVQYFNMKKISNYFCIKFLLSVQSKFTSLDLHQTLYRILMDYKSFDLLHSCLIWVVSLTFRSQFVQMKNKYPPHFFRFPIYQDAISFLKLLSF